MGVLTSFSVAKKVTEDDIQKYFSKNKRTGKSEQQIGKMLQDKILSEIHEAMQSGQIPGLISPQELAATLGIEKQIVARIPEIHRLIMVLAQKMAEKKYDKMSLCYFINSLVNVLGLTEEDFTKFHRQNSKQEDDDDDDKDDGYKDA